MAGPGPRCGGERLLSLMGGPEAGAWSNVKAEGWAGAGAPLWLKGMREECCME